MFLSVPCQPLRFYISFCNNLRGPDSSDHFFQKLPQVYVMSYQGSKSSTSEGIRKVKSPEIVSFSCQKQEIGHERRLSMLHIRRFLLYKFKPLDAVVARYKQEVTCVREENEKKICQSPFHAEALFLRCRLMPLGCFTNLLMAVF